MAIPKIISQIIHTDTVPQDPLFEGLRILRAQSDPAVLDNFQRGAYEFQSPMAGYTRLPGTLSRKGYVGTNGRPRIVVTLHPTLQVFVDMVRYDPSNPPPNDFVALGMKEMHDKTQSDFKGQKAQNKIDFRDYLLEGIRGDRPLFLPTISGWQSSKVFDQTVFVALDETDTNAMYGYIYLPRAPIMQSDGQTQTAALFAAAASEDAIEAGALNDLIVTLEVELNMDERKAGQSFADRNGRGSKKNKNLVISLDTSSALSELRIEAAKGTVFEKRLATGRNTSTSETATQYIVDLSTMEQMLLNVVSQGKVKPENFKHFHVQSFLPFARDFLVMLDELFAPKWPEQTPKGSEPFRKLYVHGWPFALKAIAKAYHRSRQDEIGPFAEAIGASDSGKAIEAVFLAEAAKRKSEWDQKDVPLIGVAEFRDRLSQIQWERYRAHWVKLAGAKIGKDGQPRLIDLEGVGPKVMSQAQNTAYIIDSVASKLVAPSWADLTKTDDAE